jgi:hypothetical protein
MRKSDLYRKWADMLDLCEGTDVSPLICVKLNGVAFTPMMGCTTFTPAFNDPPDNYAFAITILHGKPLFKHQYVQLPAIGAWDGVCNAQSATYRLIEAKAVINGYTISVFRPIAEFQHIPQPHNDD